MNDIIQRENDTGWNEEEGHIINVPVDGSPMNVKTHYGCVSTEQIRAHAIIWINRYNKQSQNKQMMVKLFLDSIRQIVRQQITNQEGSISVGTPPVKSVNINLKLIMNKTIIDTRTTLVAVKSDLSSLNSFISSCNSNIETCNAYVNHAVDSI